MKTNKVIGIPGYIHEGKNQSFGAGVNHLEFISRFGNARILMPWEENVEVDMLYLPGGLDTAPANYGENPGYHTSNQDVHKEHFFRTKLDFYLDNNTPIFGVCLGAQMLAVRFGCRLTQDLLFHAQSKDRWNEAHDIFGAFRVEGQGKKDLGLHYEGDYFGERKVNSHHHQAVSVNSLADGVQPLWLADNEDNFVSGDGAIVEAFRITGRPIFGVQWHPEELYDLFSRTVIEKLLAD